MHDAATGENGGDSNINIAARDILLDGEGGGAIAFYNYGNLSIARWHRPEDCEPAIRRAMEILQQGRPIRNEQRSEE